MLCLEYVPVQACPSEYVRPSMFVRACFSEHVCPTIPQKIRTPLFVVRAHFFIRNHLEWSKINPKLWSELQYIFLVQMPSLRMNITILEPNPNSIRSHIKINTKIIYLCYQKFCDFSNKMNFNKFPIQVWPRCY